MSSHKGIRQGGKCLRCAYFGMSRPATTTLTGRTNYGPLYCQECADYINESWPPIYPGAGPRQSRRDNPPQQEAT